VIAEVGVVAYIAWEVDLLTASDAPLKEAGVCLQHLPEIVQEIVATNAVPVLIRAQHTRQRVRLPT